jgi:hypothetical protein
MLSENQARIVKRCGAVERRRFRGDTVGVAVGPYGRRAVEMRELLFHRCETASIRASTAAIASDGGGSRLRAAPRGRLAKDDVT